MKGRNKGDLKYEGVRRWPKRHNVHIFTFDLLLFPINIRNKHLVLAGVDLTRKIFFYLSSLHDMDALGAIPNLKKWLVQEAKDKKGKVKANSLKLRSWKCYVNKYRLMLKEGLPFSGLEVVNGDIVEV